MYYNYTTSTRTLRRKIFVTSVETKMSLLTTPNALLIQKKKKEKKKKRKSRGTWVAEFVEHPTLAQVMVSQVPSSSPTSGLLLSVQSPLWILCLLLCLCPSPTFMHSFSKINKHLKKNLFEKSNGLISLH